MKILAILIFTPLIKNMLGKINLINYEKCYPSLLKKLFRADLNYLAYDKFIPQMKNAVVGNIPPEIICLFKTDKGEKIKSVSKCSV